MSGNATGVDESVWNRMMKPPINLWTNTLYHWVICEDWDETQRVLMCRRCGRGLGIQASTGSSPLPLAHPHVRLYGVWPEAHSSCQVGDGVRV